MAWISDYLLLSHISLDLHLTLLHALNPVKWFHNLLSSPWSPNPVTRLSSLYFALSPITSHNKNLNHPLHTTLRPSWTHRLSLMFHSPNLVRTYCCGQCKRNYCWLVIVKSFIKRCTDRCSGCEWGMVNWRFEKKNDGVWWFWGCCC